MFYLMILTDAMDNIQARTVAGLYTRKVVAVRDAHKLVEDDVAEVATLYGVPKTSINDYLDKGLLDASAIVFSTDSDLNPDK